MGALRSQKGIVGPKLDPEDASTWEDHNWPSSSKFLVRRVALHKQAFANRCSRNIYEAFVAIFSERRLHVSVDNWGISRGAKDNSKWINALAPHWDLNPWRYVEEVEKNIDPGYQGLVALTDQNLETGCHMTLPCCTQFAKQWCRERKLASVAKSRKSHRPSKDDPVLRYMQPIPLRKGEMVIWSWGQLHGSTASCSHNVRLHQYIRMYPSPEADRGDHYENQDRFGCARIIRKSIADGDLTQSDLDTLDSFSKRLLSIESWTDPGVEI